MRPVHLAESCLPRRAAGGDQLAMAVRAQRRHPGRPRWRCRIVSDRVAHLSGRPVWRQFIGGCARAALAAAAFLPSTSPGVDYRDHRRGGGRSCPHRGASGISDGRGWGGGGRSCARLSRGQSTVAGALANAAVEGSEHRISLRGRRDGGPGLQSNESGHRRLDSLRRSLFAQLRLHRRMGTRAG